jgi:lysophospholipase L1-like esterase
MRVITRDSKTPASVEVKGAARAPVTDPTLGIPSPRTRLPGPAQNRLVTVGDSLTQGFQSGAVYHTDVAFPRLIAHELGFGNGFRFAAFPGTGGLPLSIEYVVRQLEQNFGPRVAWWEAPEALLKLRQVLDRIEDYWERGPGATPPVTREINHNLGIYGWDLRDVLARTAASCQAEIKKPHDDLILQVVEAANARTAVRVLPQPAEVGRDMGMLDAAEALGENGGIETLIVLLGANNALPTVVELKVVWSKPGYDDLERKSAFTVWDPEHFEIELGRLAARVRRIRAEHVIWGTVPHVTIAPIARGVGDKIAPDSRYFPYYTRPWIQDADFNPAQDPFITAAEARSVDAAIDQYNDAIVNVVRQARSDATDPRDWYVFDVAGMLDRLAQRRYIESPAARPPWWTPYELPAALTALNPVPNSRFFASGPGGRTDGGLFSLDGVHPTTVGYGLLAQEFMRVMERAGVAFLAADGTRRASPVNIDFGALLAQDSLLGDPPASFTNDLRVVSWLNRTIDLVGLGRVVRAIT